MMIPTPSFSMTPFLLNIPAMRAVEEGLMADLIRTAQYFKLTIADKSGTLAHLLAPLQDVGVNLLAVHAFPRNCRTQVDVVSENAAAFKETAKSLKWKMQGPKVCFLVEGDVVPERWWI